MIIIKRTWWRDHSFTARWKACGRAISALKFGNGYDYGIEDDKYDTLYFPARYYDAMKPLFDYVSELRFGEEERSWTYKLGPVVGEVETMVITKRKK